MARLRRLAALRLADLALLIEAAAMLLLARTLLEFRSLDQLTRLGRFRHARSSSIESLPWAVDVTANLLGVTCLPRALALHWMLRERGWSPHLCLGTRFPGPALPTHAWVELEGRLLLGGLPRPHLLLCRLPRLEG